MENKIYFVVVIYNKNCLNSLTMKKLKQYNYQNIYIVDNSERDYDNFNYAKENKYTYISMNGNKGLAKAYNRAINEIDCKDEDIIMLLDDDTDLTEEYVENLEKIEKNNKDVDVFFPIIKDYNELIISPTIFTKYKLINVKKEKETINIKNDRICAINSCLAIRKKVFKEYMYDENLFLDYIDNDFFAFIRSHNISCKVIEVVIYQNLFNSSNPSLEKKYNRMKIEISDYKKYLKKRSSLEKIFGYIRIKYWIIREVIKYKNKIFLKLNSI